MPNSTKQFNVFVVDDEPIIAYSLATILRKEGFTATPFSSPIDALQAAHIRPPDLLLTDVIMPEISGIDLALSITRRNPHCKVLFFSGNAATPDLIEDVRQRGYAFDLLQKPLAPTELLQHIGALAGESVETLPSYYCG